MQEDVYLRQEVLALELEVQLEPDIISLKDIDIFSEISWGGHFPNIMFGSELMLFITPLVGYCDYHSRWLKMLGG